MLLKFNLRHSVEERNPENRTR